jgi:hypothetical protein
MARVGKRSKDETPYTEEQAPSGRKLIVTFRIPGETGDWLRHGAERKQLSLNEHVVRLFGDLQNWFGLPYTLTDELEADRKATGLDVRDYLAHLLCQRYQAVRERGPGFDAPRAAERTGSKST